jgi:hypothetical protein
MHHIHISTGFMFVAALFTVGLVGIVLAFVASMKADRRAADGAIEKAKADAAYRAAYPPRYTADELQSMHGERLAARQAVNGAPFTQAPSQYNTYAAAAPVYPSDPLTGLATGMMLGSMMGHSHDHTTIIHDSSPSYVDSSPSYSSSSSSSDSGFSYSSDSGSSSYDSGSSSGFDASW